MAGIEYAAAATVASMRAVDVLFNGSGSFTVDETVAVLDTLAVFSASVPVTSTRADAPAGKSSIRSMREPAPEPAAHWPPPSGTQVHATFWRPAGTASVSRAWETLSGPWLKTARWKTALPPADTAGVAAVLRSSRSA
ncbi:MAG: hypothetical protein ABT02_13400 [Comamonadaceae bacterium SCN 68-20]|nr:MAG: hypothetical protein ABT02_13400 [Comamonadaceae bacterium SCN 68-20]